MTVTLDLQEPCRRPGHATYTPPPAAVLISIELVLQQQHCCWPACSSSEMLEEAEMLLCISEIRCYNVDYNSSSVVSCPPWTVHGTCPSE